MNELADRRSWSVEALRQFGAVAAGNEVRFPMRDRKGAVVGWRRRRGDGSRFGDGESGPKAISLKGSHNGLLCPWPIRPENPVLVTEGEADAVAAASACWRAVIGTPGAQPGRAVIESLQGVLAGRDVVLAPDPDDAGKMWGEKIGAALTLAGCHVRLIPLLPDEDLDKRLHRVDLPHRPAELQRLIGGATALPSYAVAEKISTGAAKTPVQQRPRYISAADLARMEIPPIKWAVADLLPDIRSDTPKRP